MGQDVKTIMTRLMPLNEEIKKLTISKSLTYKKEIITHIVFVFISTQFFFFILGFDSLISCLIYICEHNEKNLFPKIIFYIFEELIDKKFFDFLSKYKDYPQKEKEEIIKASFDEKKVKYYTEDPDGVKELKNIVDNIDNQNSNLIFFYEKIFQIGFSILFPIFKDKTIENRIKNYEEFINILMNEIEKLNCVEKKIVLESFLEQYNLKYTNFLQQMIIYCILLSIKSKEVEEKNNLLKINNLYNLIIVLEKIKNGKNELNTLFNYNTKEINMNNIFMKSDEEIILLGKEIIEINKGQNKQIKHYEIIKLKEKSNFITTYICEDFSTNEILSLVKISIKSIKLNKEAFLKFKKFSEKEIGLRNYIYELNESSLKLYNYMCSETSFIMINESYDYTLKDLLIIKKKLSLIEIKNIFRQINSFLYILINNDIKNIGLKPDNILIKCKSQDINNYRVKLKYYFLSYELSSLLCANNNNKDINILLAPEIIKGVKNINKAELFTIGVILYFIFMGYYPFGNNLLEFKTNLIKGNKNIIFDENIDACFKDLLTKLLAFEPNERMEWDEYFKHDFFKVKFDDNGKIVY